ncbi:MAG: cystathionine beta-lyase [Xanthomarina sp.]|uniref:trans-sulfuration enzyme family protein n=1 Tax=Xanthomarina sp. TaxID=1931211 RepID=UPI000C35AF8F|nr:PLP-dependent aspartate aminotransferase family protein [Xanthomarina sp.]MBF61489.1 cystathionine beta-lyase [Xanthomarina sp.]HAI17895.1 cystathionine beta-lyase [Xanthomarina gelatinilytica]|tara:strand:+ start:2469 stop:3644 length:1176 start_codon:yes stop_codon:yes gene_type:complete
MNATNIIHSIPSDPLTGAISVPVYQTSTFVQEAPGLNKGFDYARSNNPTRKVLEDVVAQLEGGHSAFAFATGLAAIDAVLKLLSAGDEIIAVDDIYGGAYRLFTHVYEKLGIKVHYVDTTDAENVANVISSKTKLVWIESPTNPTLKVSDIQEISKIAKSVNALLVVDNTFASPIAQKPIVLGADIIIHSGTKYIGGHSDLVAGLVVTKTKELSEKLKFIQNASGGILGPWDCFLTIRGIETLELRYRKQCDNAFAVAAFLANHEAVENVYFPGLVSHKNHDVAKRQQNGLFGGIVSFTLKEDTQEAANKFVTNTTYFKLAESLGGVKSLLCHPPQMTHASIPREKRLQSGIKDSLIRLSCGIEDSEDLINDLSQAFTTVNKTKKTGYVKH